MHHGLLQNTHPDELNGNLMDNTCYNLIFFSVFRFFFRISSPLIFFAKKHRDEFISLYCRSFYWFTPDSIFIFPFPARATKIRQREFFPVYRNISRRHGQYLLSNGVTLQFPIRGSYPCDLGIAVPVKGLGCEYTLPVRFI